MSGLECLVMKVICRLEYSSVTIQRLPARDECYVLLQPLQRTATHCNALQRSATHCSTPRCNALQRTFFHTLQITSTLPVMSATSQRSALATHRHTLVDTNSTNASSCADGTGAVSLSLSLSLFLYVFHSSYISFSRSRTRVGCCSLSYSRALAFVLFPLFLLLPRAPFHACSLSCSHALTFLPSPFLSLALAATVLRLSV